MTLQMNDALIIENLRNYPAETVAQLRSLLQAGASAQVDPHRENFYELENGRRVFYIHISPVSGKVWLLACWPKEGEGAELEPAAD